MGMAAFQSMNNHNDQTRAQVIQFCASIGKNPLLVQGAGCLLYTSDAADERSSVDLGGRRIIKKKKKINQGLHKQSNQQTKHKHKKSDRIKK